MVEIDVDVRWTDLDPYRHVNNAAVLTLFEEARIKALYRDASRNPGPLAVLPVEAQFFAVHQEIEYRAPIEYGAEPLSVLVWVCRLGASSFTLGYSVGQDLAVATATFVFVEAGRPAPIPEEVRRAWQDHLAPPPAFRGTD